MPSKLSVVIPLYNKEGHIIRCLESVLAQTFMDFEVIVVDDGSEDAGAELVGKLDDSRIRLHRQSNQGVSVARNTGVALAESSTIFFLDADDTWSPRFLEQMVSLISRNPTASAFGCGTRKIYANGDIKYTPIDPAHFRSHTSLLADYFDVFLAYGSSPFSNSSYGVSREKFLEAGGYTPGVRLTEDSALWCRLATIGDIAFLNEPLADYFVETSGNTRTAYQVDDYEVINTLTKIASSDSTRKEQQASARRLLVYQKISQIKRLIIVNKGLQAIRRLLDHEVWIYRPMDCLLLTLLSITPRRIVEAGRRMKDQTR